MTINSDIRSFSSYTKGLHIVHEILIDEEFAQLKLQFSAEFLSKIEKRIQKFKSALSIDGVYSVISFNKTLLPETKNVEVIAMIAKDIFTSSALINLNAGNKVNIGMLSNNPEKWLLDSLPIGKVKLIKVQIADNHTYTKELEFECSKDLYARIQNLQYIGLNGSGLFLRNPQNLDGHYFFTIHAGRDTRETTLLGNDDLLLGAEFSLTSLFILNDLNYSLFFVTKIKFHVLVTKPNIVIFFVY